MPQLDTLFDRRGAGDSFGSPQCYEATVVATGSNGPYVVLTGFDRQLRWGPCAPAGAAVKVGDKVSVSFSEAGVPWLSGGGGGGGGGDSDNGNVDGGFPDSVYGGVPEVDGNGVTR